MIKKRVVLVFLKYPEAGRVKTRLARDVGEDEAARIYAEMVRRVLGVIAGLQGVAVWICYDPAGMGGAVREWVGELAGEAAQKWDFLGQVEGDLGERMRVAIGAAVAAGYCRVGVVGTDCLELSGELFTELWQMLEGVDVVFGPARDGGYYLLGVKGVCDGILEGIEWSSERTLEMSLSAATAAGLSVGQLALLRDVDTLADWESMNCE
ncbi:MAG: TIGR04282 family arsenosugar biosynthesis glycosyltransferase [Verrucomicrobiota bacterium]